MLTTLFLLMSLAEPVVSAQESETIQHDARVGSDLCLKSASKKLCRDAYLIAQMSQRQVRACRFTVKSPFRETYAGDPRFEEDFKTQCSMPINICESAYQYSYAARSESGQIRNEQGVNEWIRQTCRWEPS